ncbi:ABC transporter ATP-binding protein [Aliigemmobacter aestuarii]|uniref:Spermidine/putrescine import ATP-binding protein PotA n=1 Tax=Aliigemmobacter aestuarii TaxID=1445661 RepID=A0A4S3MLM2_9RHOB|nr:ABC transporter ATP-binding protein [Gemmobacter aestuarii]THD80833.1 ABC transporter ATP-binding protein [Gemmobacter aestuarii]
MNSAPSAIAVRSVSKSFGRGDAMVRVLSDVSVEIGVREFFTLLGPSGCGKTTLLRLIAGFEELDSGDILIDGVRVDHLPPFRRPVNTVFQSYALFPHLTVAQNVAFALELQDLPRAEVRRRAGEALEMVRMGALAARKPAELSGGQQQRVALARALAPRPKVLLLDEPLSALDLKLRKEMQIELKQLQAEAGITFVFVTHDQEEALTLSDRIAVMQGGRILQLGTPREIYERPAHRFVADFIGEINLLEGQVSGHGKVRLDCGAEISAGAGQAAGARVTVAIRPERARLVRGGVLQAEVTHVAYLGTATIMQLRLADGGPFLLRAAADDLPAIGGRVQVDLPSDALQVFAA